MRLHHAGVSVPDLDRSLQWYCAALGLTPGFRFEVPPIGLRGAFALGDGGTGVELLEMTGASPGAAKTASFARALLWIFADIGLDILHLMPPPAVIPEEGLCPPLAGNLFKARFRHRQQSTAGCWQQSKLHQGRRLFRIIHLRVD